MSDDRRETQKNDNTTDTSTDDSTTDTPTDDSASEETESANSSRFDRFETWVTANDLRLVVVLSAAVYALFVVLALAAGFRGDGFVSRLQTVTFFATIFAMLALALNLQWGYAGLANLGIAGFMAVGVYTMALLSMPSDASVPGLGLPLPIGMLGGFLMATAIGALAALPALRLRADYLAIVTLAFGEIIRRIARSRQFETFDVGGTTLGFGGINGLRLPRNPVERVLYDDTGTPTSVGELVLDVGESLGIRQTVVESILYVILLVIVTVLLYLLLVRVVNSPFGRVLKAIREDELAASSLGKDTRKFKVKAFALGCGLMGLVAMLWFMQRGSVSPDTLEPELTFFIFVALILGGSGSNTGAVVGGIVFAALLWEGPGYIQRIVDANFDRPSQPDTIFDGFRSFEQFIGYFFSDVNITAFQFVVLGVILIYLMQQRPDGLLGHRVEIASNIDLSKRSADSETKEGE